MATSDPGESLATVHRLEKATSAAPDDGALVRSLVDGERRAQAVLFDRYAPTIHRVLLRVIGNDGEVEDLLQETFLRAIDKIGSLDDPERLKSWLMAIAVYVARGEIRRRKRRRWLRYRPPEELPEGSKRPNYEANAAVEATYQVLERMPADERIAFALRHIEHLELTEVAAACEVSLATIKRRLGKAQHRFVALAAHYPVLEPWVVEARWRKS